MPIEPLLISAHTTVNALGRGLDTTLDALRAGRGGLRPCDFEDAILDTWVGRVAGLEDAALTGALAVFDCRNNRLAALGLCQDDFADHVRAARARYGADRVGVFIGTSTSGILTTELAYRRRDAATGEFLQTFDYRHSQDVFATADFCQTFFGLTGPAQGISTACSSSAKAFAVAWRYIQAGLCDAALVGGVDSLCLTTLYGFNSLELTSSQPCRPWDGGRDGLSLGEAASFALLERCPDGPPAGAITLRGYGESSDAHHMSSAHPEGVGALSAMTQALERAGLAPDQIDYVNLHGTATPANDVAEDKAVVKLFGTTTPCSSTKGWTGHTLGAAGALEAVFTCLCLQHGFIPASLNTRHPDPALRANVPLQTLDRPLNAVMSNSFGFGGTNCSLIFVREAG